MPAPESVEELRQLRAIPVHFGWVVPGEIAGMAMPTSAFQLQCLREQLQVDLVINLTQRDLHRNAIQTLQEGEAPQLLHFPLKGFFFPSFVPSFLP